MKNRIELENPEESYRLVLEKLNICFFSYDMEKRILKHPENTRKVFGCREFYENMPESFAEDFVAKEYRADVIRLYEDCHAGKDNGECVFEDKERRFLVCVKMQIIRRDENGKPLSAIGIIDNQVSAKNLLQKQSRYIDALLSSSTGYMEINLSKDRIIGDIIDSRSEKGPVIVEYPLKNPKTRSFDEFELWWSKNMLASDPEEFLRVSNCAYLISCYEEGKHVVNIVCRSRTAEGEITDSRQTYYLSKDNSTGDIQAICIVYDLTKQKRQETDIRFSNLIIQKLSDEFDAIAYADLDADTMIDYRTDGTWASWDNIEKESFSYSKRVEEFTEFFVLEEDREKFREYWAPETIKAQLAKHPSYSFEYRIKREDEIHYYRIRMVADSEISEHFCVIVGFRNVDREMERQKFLEETLQYAEHASKAKTNFLSNMSHDMRTPMNAIIGFTALAGVHLDNRERVKGYLEKITTASNHLLSLINDILDMSRIESGKVVLNENAENLADILHDLRAMVQSQVSAKQMDFFIDTCDVKNELIYCDKIRLKQVLLNIFSNAVKYTSPGGIVSVRIIQRESKLAGYGNYEFRIKDTGKGMSKEFLEHIFEPFEREERNERDITQGTGLGLSIVKNIVDMMDGTIEINSAPGKGSEFIVSLSFKLQEGERIEYDFSKIAGFRALVVDDDFHTCDTVMRMLREIGMRPEFTMHGREAVLKARHAHELQDDFFVYIIDWLMPDMNGLEVVRRIRKEIGDEVPIIILTAYDWEGIQEEAKEAGVTAICEKPLFISNLKRIIAASCGGEESLPEEEKQPEADMDFSGKKVLLVEDIEINREIANELLTEKGFTVSSAINGQEAVEMVERAVPGDYDIILMDIRMPVMNGYEATRRIRQMDSPYKDIPIVAMTANAFTEDVQMSFMAGMNGHISKPLDEEEMFKELWKLLA